MNCREREERIALYAGADLPGASAVEVERHLRDCAGCQVFASGLREALDLLRDQHTEPVAAAHYTALRARVLGALDRPRRVRRWLWAPAALALVLAAGVGIDRRMRVAPLPHVPLRARAAPALTAAPARPNPPARPRRPARPAPKPSRRSEPVLVRLQTSDPDVVILWITETKGDL
jgi:hypothetical protein